MTMGLKSKARTLPASVYAQPPTSMIAAKVLKFSARRGSGVAVLKSSGKQVRIPWSALKAASVATLSPGDEIFVGIDSWDKSLVESLFVPSA